MATVYRSAHIVVQHHRASAHVRVIRSGVQFESVPQVVKTYAACRRAVAVIDPARHGILFDVRQGPLSTDAQLHRALVEQVDLVASDFARSAILVQTSVGSMQVHRVGRNLSAQALAVFNEESAALRYLSERREPGY